MANEERAQLRQLSERLDQLAAAEASRERERARVLTAAEVAARALHAELSSERSGRENAERTLALRDAALHEQKAYDHAFNLSLLPFATIRNSFQTFRSL